MRVGVVAPPAHYTELLSGMEGVDLGAGGDDLDAMHLFFHKQEDVEAAAVAAIARLRAGGMLWVSWPKKASSLFCGLTEDGMRAGILPLGWVDVKVCAVDADWSGLKFLKRRRK